MAQTTCPCGVSIPSANGRPRKFCLTCRPIKASGYVKQIRTPKTCQQCGAPFMATMSIKYCSTECREAAHFANAARVPCSICGRPTGYRVDQAQTATHNECSKNVFVHGTHKGYKSAGCRCTECVTWFRQDRATYLRERKAHPRTGHVCNIEGCSSESWTRGMCMPHYKQWARANGMVKAEPWTDTKRDNWHRRRARLAGYTKADQRALLSEVIERDGNECAWCHLPVDLTLTWPNRMYKSLDHTVPLSRGGAHTLSNARLMHFACNSSKGAHVA